MGDFNIQIFKNDMNDVTKLINNIFLNSVKYPWHSGNLTIALSDHLIQFVISEGFFKELVKKK